jgi:hypothetical protein
MAEPIYTSHVTVRQPGNLHRRARLETGEQVDFGVHGPIRELFRLSPEREFPLPVDYIVAAAGG